jgi:hypothetical protein
MASAKCPKCDRVADTLVINPAKGKAEEGGAYHLLTFSCQYCDAIIGVQLNPFYLTGKGG